MFGWKLRFVAISAAVLLYFFAGIPLFSTPEYEIVYSQGSIKAPCGQSGCPVLYNLSIGNSGSKDQDVSVTFYSDAIGQLALKPSIANFGKTPRRYETEMTDALVTYHLGNLEPGKRVDLALTIIYSGSDPVLSWEELLHDVNCHSGGCRFGSLENVRMGRLLFRVFG